MVSLWPWKGDDSSPAAFEKTLSTLSTKIGQVSGNLESTRQRGRRLKALWTLYASFAYLLYLMIAGLVVGWQSWGAVEYTAVSSAPVAIYVVRFALSGYYDYRTSNLQSYLQSLQKQRDETINKLKEATKYNTTQQLLEKYGGTPYKPALKPKKESQQGDQRGQQKQQQKRRETTGFVPPPTANIPGRRVVSATAPGNAQIQGQGRPSGPMPGQGPQPGMGATPPPWPQGGAGSMSAGAEFAPNAFSEPRVYVANNDGPKWYDRLMDVVLGEDEASPKNRLALICQECRLVNGLAPPGAKNLAQVGKWRCSACGTMNGEDAEAKRLVEGLTGQAEEASPVSPVSPVSPTQASVVSEVSLKQGEEGGGEEGEKGGEESDHTVYSDDEEEEEEEEEGKGDEDEAKDTAAPPQTRQTRSRGKKAKS